ncbi:MAG: MBL fold metallo-hydrolase [Bacteroidales bacterium]|nr:MBL fold metallo-hydrolase [Bacteroidales bacterium]
MEIYPLIAENWKMDGGVAFGVVPQTIWRKLVEPDDNNMVKITSRCLLVKHHDRLILFDTGMGNKQSKKYYGYRFLFGHDSLQSNFKKSGFSFDDVTDVVFTHLHDDHCGGAVNLNEKGEPELLFKNATHHCTSGQWEWANHPNKREIGSFFKINFQPIEEAGKLNLIESEGEFLPGIDFRFMNGHTQGMIVPLFRLDNKTVVFMADFIPSAAHIPVPFLASVDIQPLVALQEKEQFLNEAAYKGYYLVFEHDYDTECVNVVHTGKGVRADKTFRLNEFLN